MFSAGRTHLNTHQPLKEEECMHNMCMHACTRIQGKENSWIKYRYSIQNSHYKSTWFMDFSVFILSHHLGLWKTSVAQKVPLRSAAALQRTAAASHSLPAIYSAIWKRHMKVFCTIFFVQRVNSTRGRCNADIGFRLEGGKLRYCPTLLPSLILTDDQREEDHAHTGRRKENDFQPDFWMWT